MHHILLGFVSNCILESCKVVSKAVTGVFKKTRFHCCPSSQAAM